MQIIEVFRSIVPKGLVLDPLGGIGRLGRLGSDWKVITSDIEKTWACQGLDNGTAASLTADARSLPFLDSSFNTVVTSPSYGNRLADRDASQRRSMTGGFHSDGTRRTYRRYLGKELHPANSGGMQWGPGYQRLHDLIWQEVWRVLKPGGLFILNVKDHVRNGLRQPVVEWHHRKLLNLGFLWRGGVSVPLSGDQNTNRLRRQGRETVNEEDISIWLKPETFGMVGYQALPSWCFKVELIDEKE